MREAKSDIEKLLQGYKDGRREADTAAAMLEVIQQNEPPERLHGPRVEEIREKLQPLRYKYMTRRAEALRQAEAVERLLDSLPERSAQLLRLHYIQGAPFEAVAAAMHYSPQHIYHLKKRALDDLAKVATAAGLLTESADTAQERPKE